MSTPNTSPPTLLTTPPEPPQPSTLLNPTTSLHPPNPLPRYLQENELPQECKDLIATLPCERGWVASYLHQYQGFWHTTRQLKGVLACQKQLQVHASDIYLVTTPKSGTTWLKALTFAIVKRVQYNDFKQHPLLTNNPHVLVPFMEMEYIDNESPDFTTNFTSTPRLFSTHLPLVSLPKNVVDLGCKLVYLCRNPEDTFVSIWHFANRLRLKEKGEISIEEAFDKYCRGVSLYGPFWDHVLGYWKERIKNPERVLFLKYEEMKNEPKVQLKRLAEFLGCPFSLEEEASGVVDEILELCSFDNLRNLEVNKSGKLSSGEDNQAFFRRGEIGDSTNYLTDEMVEKMDKITEQIFGGSGLIF